MRTMSANAKSVAKIPVVHTSLDGDVIYQQTYLKFTSKCDYGQMRINMWTVETIG